MEASMVVVPMRRKYMKPIGWPARADSPAAATLAAAAMSVALPPKQAPRASAHQYASSSPPPCSESTTGIMAAVKGMLSTTAEPSAEAQAMPSSSAVRSPSVSDAMPWATSSIAPRSSSAPTSTKRPMKKNSVGHSIEASERSSGARLVNSITVAPAIATVAGSMCSAWWAKKVRIVATRTGTVRLSSSRSSIALAGSSSMTRKRASGLTCNCRRNRR
jgi:hypothetical protein